MDAASLLTNPNVDINVFQSPPPQLPPYAFPDQLVAQSEEAGTTTPPSVPKSKRRKLSAYNDDVKADEEDDDLDDGLQRNGSARKSRPAGTKRACNQCRQQKVRLFTWASPTFGCAHIYINGSPMTLRTR
jgi:hypothetical protein